MTIPPSTIEAVARLRAWQDNIERDGFNSEGFVFDDLDIALNTITASEAALRTIKCKACGQTWKEAITAYEASRASVATDDRLRACEAALERAPT